MNTELAAIAVLLIGGCVPAPTGTGASTSTPSAAPSPRAPRFPVSIVPSTNPVHARLAAALGDNDPFSTAEALTSISLDNSRFPQIPITVDTCGEPNAFYDPNRRTILVCFELIELIGTYMQAPAGTLNTDARIGLLFITLHEMGHAWIDLLDLTASAADEEERADQLALLLMTDVNDHALARTFARAPAAFFAEHGTRVVQRSEDVHQPHTTRAAQAMCMYYGLHPDAGAREIEPQLLAKCRTYAEEARQTWNRVLRPYSRIDTGITF